MATSRLLVVSVLYTLTLSDSPLKWRRIKSFKVIKVCVCEYN